MTYPLGVPVVYTPLLHHCDPTCCHTLCPKLHQCKSPPCPHSHSLQPVEYQCHCRLSLRMKRMKKCVMSSVLKSIVCWNWSKANSHALTPLMSYCSTTGTSICIWMRWCLFSNRKVSYFGKRHQHLHSESSCGYGLLLGSLSA